MEALAGILEELAEMLWEWPEMLLIGDDWSRRVWEYYVSKVYSVLGRPQMSVQLDGIVLGKTDGMPRKGELKSFGRVLISTVEVEAISLLVQTFSWSR